MNPGTLTVVTYNIHRCIGVDRQYSPSRIARVLKEINADIVGLQEVDTGLFQEPPVPVHEPGPVLLRPHQLEELAQNTGHSFVEGFIRRRKAGLFGNALLTSHEVVAVRRIDLTIRGAFERRGALDVDLRVHGTPLRVVVAHLGLGVWERYFQVRRLLRALGTERMDRVLMMGDFNLWTSMFPKLRRLNRRLGPVPLVRTFPSFLPILSLDRLWVQPHKALLSAHAHRSSLSRVASDHLPLVGTLQF
jgi:endonuclease/exonuclease/phosphatase family metal-dependent hydrolase